MARPMAEGAAKAVREETGRLAAPDGVELFWREWLPAEGRARAAILFAHGAGEHSGRYQAFGRYFASRGIPVLAFDLRGLGQSGGRRGHVDSFSDYVRDLLLFRARLAERHPGAKVVLAGHSTGGLLALAAAEGRGEAFDAVVASAPALELSMKVPGWKATLGRMLAKVAPRLTMTNEINAADLARNPEVGRRYVADPHVCKLVSTRWFVEFVATQARVMAEAGKVARPVFILQGTDDRLVRAEASRAFYERLGSIPKSFRHMEGFYHELFQEDQREEVFALILEWLRGQGLAG